QLDTASGSLSYALDNTRAATQALAQGTSNSDALTITVKDGANVAAATTVTFTVTGTNDAPTVSASAPSATLVESGYNVVGTSSSSVTLSKADVDTGDSAVYDLTGWTLVSGSVYTMPDALPDVQLDTASGS